MISPLLLLCLYIVFWPSPAWAVQAHGGAEGLISHQIGHLLFIIGMAFLLFRVHSGRLVGLGWREFKWFICLILLWNCLTFSGHWMRELVDTGKFLKTNSHIAGFQVTNTFDFIFYLTRLDHILLVPAFLFLFLALKRWGQTP